MKKKICFLNISYITSLKQKGLIEHSFFYFTLMKYTEKIKRRRHALIVLYIFSADNAILVHIRRVNLEEHGAKVDPVQ